MVKVAAVTGFDGEPSDGADTGANESVMDGSRGERHGDGDILFDGQTVGEQQDGGSAAHQIDRLGAEVVEGRDQVAGRIEDTFEHSQRQVAGEAVAACVKILHLGKRKERRRQREAGERRALVEHMRPRTEAGVQLHDAGFADGVGRRIGDLGRSVVERRRRRAAVNARAGLAGCRRPSTRQRLCHPWPWA